MIKLFEYGFGIRIFGQFYHQQLKTSFYHLALFVFIALGILNLKMADNNNNDCKDVKTVEKRTKSLVTFLSLIYKGRSSRWSAWWAKHSSQFKTLSVLAEKYLAIPATETTSERVFSVAGLTATRTRANLSPEHVNMLVLLHENIDLLDQK